MARPKFLLLQTLTHQRFHLLHLTWGSVPFHHCRATHCHPHVVPPHHIATPHYRRRLPWLEEQKKPLFHFFANARVCSIIFSLHYARATTCHRCPPRVRPRLSFVTALMSRVASCIVGNLLFSICFLIGNHRDKTVGDHFSIFATRLPYILLFISVVRMNLCIGWR